MTKFIQICASRDDLFALDDAGDLYQFNFNTKAWVKLAADRSFDGGLLRGGGPSLFRWDEGTRDHT